MKIDPVNSTPKGTPQLASFQVEKRGQETTQSSMRASYRKLRHENAVAAHQVLKGAEPYVIEIRSLEQFEEELRNSKVPVVVDFYATWCGPCKMIGPVYEGLAKTHEGKVKFLKVNVDEVRSLLDKYNVKAMPTFLFFDQNGNLTERLVGANAAKLQEIINKLAN